MTSVPIIHDKFFEGLATTIEQLQTRFEYPNSDIAPISHLLRTDQEFQKAFLELLCGNARIVLKT